MQNEEKVSIPDTRNDYLTSYCRRPDDGEKLEKIADTSDERVMKKIVFQELKKEGVTSQQLLNWSAPINVAERYEMDNGSSEFFYNCSLPWFGSKCQYRFSYNLSLSFGEIVEHTMKSRVSTTTCYRLLTSCDRGPWLLCLDWREICDGKADCVSGEDEQWCEMLEMTTCSADDEYRCHYGGQCIPILFVRDGRHSVDCLESSDEIERNLLYFPLQNIACSNSYLFWCEERTSRYPFTFPCGNGQYWKQAGLPINYAHCSNKRDNRVTLAMLTSFEHIEDADCRETFRCLLLSNRSYGFNMNNDMFQSLAYFEGNWENDCEFLENHCSDKWLVLPAKPIMYGFFSICLFQESIRG